MGFCHPRSQNTFIQSHSIVSITSSHYFVRIEHFIFSNSDILGSWEKPLTEQSSRSLESQTLQHPWPVDSERRIIFRTSNNPPTSPKRRACGTSLESLLLTILLTSSQPANKPSQPASPAQPASQPASPAASIDGSMNRAEIE